MENALDSILPQAIGVAISPVPIIAVILILISKRARSNSPAFLVDWMVALVVVSSIVLILANLGKTSTGGTPSTLAYVL
jgi:heme/copper-type cytochrome/quinol oxidase subunit 3